MASQTRASMSSEPMAAGAIKSTSVLNFISHIEKGSERKPTPTVGRQ